MACSRDTTWSRWRTDLHFFPPYEAGAVLSPRVNADRPDVVSVLSLLSGRLDEGRMREYNRRIEVDREADPGGRRSGAP